MTQDSPGAKAIARFYRWGWIPLVIGCVLIGATVFAGWELILSHHAADRSWHLARGIIAAGLEAAWAGGYVLFVRTRLEAERTRLLLAAAKREEEARHAEATVGLSALCRALTHEIRSPLHGITLYATRLRKIGQRQREALGGELIDLADRIDGQARAVDELLADYASYGVPHAPFERVEVHLGAVVMRVLEELSGRAEGHAAKLTVEIADALSPIRGDPARMHQAISILVRNALESVSPGGKVQVSARMSAGRLELSVSNDGPVPTDLDALFRPFHPGTGHTGLAYAIVRDVMRAHGGEVKASPWTAGHGTRVELTLPVEAA